MVPRRLAARPRWLLPALIAGIALGAIVAYEGCPRRVVREELDDPNAPPARGEELVLALQAEPTTLLEPFCTIEDEINVAALLFPTLLSLEFRGDLTHVPALADRYERAPDGTHITFHLKEGRWSDGAPITADDVAFTFDLVRNPRFPAPRRENLTAVEGLDVLDARTVRFRFRAPYYVESQLTDVNLGVLPRHVYSSLTPEEVRGSERALSPVGHGPFRLVSRQGTSLFVLERNEECVSDSVPLLKRLVFVSTSDYAARKNALWTGAVDAIDGVRVEDAEAFRERGGFRVVPRGLRSVEFVVWNVQRPLFSDPAVRRALTHAIDRPGMIRALFRTKEPGFVAEAVGTVPPVLAGAVPPDLTPLPFDPRRAEEELEAAGWRRPGGAGTRAKDGVPFSFTLLVNSETPRRVQTARMIQQDLTRIGVDCRVREVPFDALKGTLDRREFEAALYGFSASLQWKQGDVWSRGGGFNLSGYEDPAVEELVARARDETDPAKLRDGLQELQRIVHRDQPMTFLCWFSRISVVKSRFRGFEPNVISFVATVSTCFVPRNRQVRFVGL